MLDRTTPPPIRQLSEFSITRPDRRTMKNGMPLNIIHAGTEDVVRFDLLIGGGQWNQEQPLQAMFANRMLPDAVFIGGHGGHLEEMIEKVKQVLHPEGCIVFNSVSAESKEAFCRLREQSAQVMEYFK